MQQHTGIFSPFFDSSPGYLDFLNLNSAEASHSVSRVIECCRLSSDPFQDIGRLLEESNWRFHLVAAVALSAIGYDRTAFNKLWSAIDAGSWVTPQLAVVAYLRDPDFIDRARVRVQSRCPVDTSRFTSMTPFERHVAAGPAGAPQRSAKAVNALIYLLSLFPGPLDWLTTELASPDLATLLSEDRDHASSIAEHWLASLKTILHALAIKMG
jgi:hypothetical protein